jgi:hypothetical protein
MLMHCLLARIKQALASKDPYLNRCLRDKTVHSFRHCSAGCCWRFCCCFRIMNLIGGVGMDKEYQDDATSASAGKVHHGFHALVHDFPDNCTLAETPITVSC